MQIEVKELICKVENLRSKLYNIKSDIEKKEDTLLKQSIHESSALDLAQFNFFVGKNHLSI